MNSSNGIDRKVCVFLKELEEIRKTGLAYDLDEHSSGVSAIGISFRDRGGDLHAISVPVPSTRFQEHRKKVENALKQTMESIQNAF